MARPADQSATLSTILWAALGYLAGKRTDKTLLTVGESTKVDVTITGKIGRKSINEHICGSLKLNPDGSKAKNSAAPAAHIVALLLAEFPDDARRAEVIAKIVSTKERTKQLPTVTAAQTDHAKKFLARLRSSTTTKVSGALVFSLIPPKAKLAPKPES